MGKGSSKGHTPREAKDNLKSTQLLSVIDAISEGPVEGPVDGLKSVLLNSTPVLDSEAEETKNNLMQVASEHIAPLQDAADLEIATEEEISLLEAWKKYRVLLNRVDTSTAQDIEWPALP